MGFWPSGTLWQDMVWGWSEDGFWRSSGRVRWSPDRLQRVSGQAPEGLWQGMRGPRTGSRRWSGRVQEVLGQGSEGPWRVQRGSERVSEGPRRSLVGLRQALRVSGWPLEVV